MNESDSPLLPGNQDPGRADVPVESGDVEDSPLLGKKEWHDAVVAKVEEAHQQGIPLSVLFIDVNYFKDVNDTLGHEAGDQVIDKISKLVNSVASSFRTAPQPDYPARSLDKVAVGQFGTHLPDIDLGSSGLADFINMQKGRIGGDEFAILCEAGESGAAAISQRVRQMFEEFLEQPENSQLKEIGLGLAIGHSTLAKDMSAEELLRDADIAMYEDKLDQLPDLTEKQKVALHAARILLEANGIRLRDVHKYWRLHPVPNA